MKRLIFVNGTMGAGKTAACGELLQILDRSVFLDGDWCWMMNPFVVTDETKRMVQDNIVHLLRSFLACSEYKNVIFCWVMQYESIMDDLLAGLKGMEFQLYRFTLTVSEQALTARIQKDVANRVRTPDVLERSLQRLPLYEKMNTVKIDVSSISARQAAERIADEINARTCSEKPMFMSRGNPAGMKRRLSFNEDAANYDRRRPGYPKELYADVIRYSGIEDGARALEIGIGTGKATEPFLRIGCNVTAVEIGEKLAGYVEEKFKAYSGLAVKNLPFEEFKGEDGSFDLIYSATAFHWVPEEIGFPKALRLLKSGGALALWWNHAFVGRPDDELHQEIQRVYKKYRLGSGGDPIENDTARWNKIQKTILSYGFTELTFKLFHGERTFGADEYVELLNTYSDHRGMATDIKEKFESEISQTIRNHGNRLTVYDTVDLYLARKP